MIQKFYTQKHKGNWETAVKVSLIVHKEVLAKMSATKVNPLTAEVNNIEHLSTV